MKPKKVLKGFTLIELIIVVVIFGMIIAVALGLLVPLGKVNQSAAVTADKQAISEDLRRFVEDNLQYADRMAVYTNYTLSEDGSIVSLQKQIEDFRTKYYFLSVNGTDDDGHIVSLKRKYAHSSLKNNDDIFVMQIDNPDSTVIADALSGVSPLRKNVSTPADRLGTVTLRKFTAGTEVTSSTRTWALNSDYYNDYAFNINLQTLAREVVSGTSMDTLQPLNGSYSSTDPKLLPSNFSMGITMYKKQRISGNPTNATLINTDISRTISFKLKNIVDDNSNLYNETIEFETPKVAAKMVGRYVWYDSTPGYTFSQKLDSTATVSNDIYIIFTKSPDIQKIVH